MEGIRDGRAVDRCFYCALLYPELELCPRCGNRLHYRPARMAPSQSLQESWSELVKRFQAGATREHAQEVLEFYFENHAELDFTLDSPGSPSLEELRQSFGRIKA